MKKNAFTLIEMVVVVLILGIMAAVAAPRMFNKAEQASENATRSQLNILRNAIELYSTENDSTYPAPTSSAGLDVLLSDYINGQFPAPQAGATKGIAAVKVVTGASVDPASQVGGTDEGWVYNKDNGKIVVNDATLKAW